jgi:hypothetical protein
VYLTTNLVNNRKYIGVRTYKNTVNDDKYFGSGSIIKVALDKYGKDNFKREILFEGSAKECYAYEKKVVTQAVVDNPEYYNISLGGWGGYRGKEATAKMRNTLKDNYKKIIRGR